MLSSPLLGRVRAPGSHTANLRVGEDPPFSTEPATVNLTVTAAPR